MAVFLAPLATTGRLVLWLEFWARRWRSNANQRATHYKRLKIGLCADRCWSGTRKCEWRVRGYWGVVSYVMLWCCCCDYVELNCVGLREGSYDLNVHVCLS